MEKKHPLESFSKQIESRTRDLVALASIGRDEDAIGILKYLNRIITKKLKEYG